MLIDLFINLYVIFCQLGKVKATFLVELKI